MHLEKSSNHQLASAHRGILWDVHTIPPSPQLTFPSMVTTTIIYHHSWTVWSNLPSTIASLCHYCDVPLSSSTLPWLTSAHLSQGTGKRGNFSMLLFIWEVQILVDYLTLFSGQTYSCHHRHSVAAISCQGYNEL